MLNTSAFIVIAGDPSAWDAQQQADVAAGKSLVKSQEEQHAACRRSAELVRSMKGWTVRHGSGLDNFAIMHRTGTHDPTEALAWGKAWAEHDPKFREFYVRRSEIKRAQADNVPNVAALAALL